MRWLVRGVVALAAVVLLAGVALFAGVGPVAFLPGGVLWGTVAEPPQDWSFTDSIGEIQLQTHVGPLPWSVTIWVLSAGGDLFVAASDCDRVWTERVKADPDVRLRIEGTIYELAAYPEDDRAVGARLAPVVLAKYLGIETDSANWIEGATNGCAFRVEPRP